MNKIPYITDNIINRSLVYQAIDLAYIFTKDVSDYDSINGIRTLLLSLEPFSSRDAMFSMTFDDTINNESSYIRHAVSIINNRTCNSSKSVYKIQEFEDALHGFTDNPVEKGAIIYALEDTFKPDSEDRDLVYKPHTHSALRSVISQIYNRTPSVIDHLNALYNKRCIKDNKIIRSKIIFMLSFLNSLKDDGFTPNNIYESRFDDLCVENIVSRADNFPFDDSMKLREKYLTRDGFCKDFGKMKKLPGNHLNLNLENISLCYNRTGNLTIDMQALFKSIFTSPYAIFTSNENFMLLALYVVIYCQVMEKIKCKIPFK